MLPHLQRCARRTPLPGIVAPLYGVAAPLLAIAALIVSICLLSPTAASAHHGKAYPESSAGEQSATTPPQEPATNPPAATEIPTQPSTEPSIQPSTEPSIKPSTEPPTQPSTASSSEPPAKTPREERRARRHAAEQTGCSVDLEATPSTITPGASLGLAGTLRCPEGVNAAGQTVTLYRKVAHTPGFSVAATATTEASGAFQFSLSEVEVNNVFYVRCDGARSTRTRVRVALQVNIEAPVAGTRLFVGTGTGGHTTAAGTSTGMSASAVTFSGTVSPVDEGATVALQREYRPERWHRIGLGQVNDEGKYSIPHTFFQPGVANLRVVVRSHGTYETSSSATVTYDISRPPRHGRRK